MHLPDHITLFTSYYCDSLKQRHAENIECLKRNINNPIIDKLVVIIESKSDLRQFKIDMSDVLLDRVTPIIHAKRPTYQYYFELANQLCSSISIIANTDIYFDGTIAFVKKMLPFECWALSRWDVMETGEANHWNHPDSQDVWIFKGPIKDNIECDFKLGVPGCDNRIAHEIEKAGYIIYNPSLTVKSYHLHIIQKRNYNSLHTIPPPYKMLHSCQL